MNKLRFWLGHLEDVFLESPMTRWLERHPVLAPITLEEEILDDQQTPNG